MFVPHEYQKKPKHVQQIWIDLKLVKQWNEVKIEDRQGISFIIGKPNPQDEEQIVFPVLSSEFLSMEKIQNLFQNLSPTKSSIMLAIIDSDSTLVYYRLYNGICLSNMDPNQETKVLSIN